VAAACEQAVAPGQYFGELALLTGQARAASVLVRRPSCCLNDAPCPPLTSHGASIAHPLLAVCLVFLVCFSVVL
jgi:hypothetical protein